MDEFVGDSSQLLHNVFLLHRVYKLMDMPHKHREFHSKVILRLSISQLEAIKL
eukprot:TRINITY_DN10021_c0_g1_i1.p4 TRINITY_DN10021_c0_g1~~TRINITY_DN10021_c0_g1_i1.p4  ORF type:complete len:53 (-),score=1.99 TRINITY_DN10021_c0_g1_i1:173-331(-)